ncbi:MAG: hypothetical protein QI199_03810 [Candidatus Korarchaeota archaeon]|nr:hypothetical protein [Candidatus Korarchaeota archaeon]
MFSDPTIEANISDEGMRISIEGTGRCALLSDRVSVIGGRSYFLTWLISSSSGLVGEPAAPNLIVGVRWLDASGSLITISEFRVRGSAPQGRRFTAEVVAPPRAAYAEAGIVVTSVHERSPVSLLISEGGLISPPREAEWHPLNLSSVSGYFTAYRNDLHFQLSVERGGVVRMNLTVTNFSSHERAVEVALALPVPESWSWDDDPISDDDGPSLVNALYWGYMPVSLYPLAVSSDGSDGLALSVPLDWPVVFQHFRDHRGFGTSFKLGLTGAGTSHSVASVCVEMFKATSFREAVGRYYSLHPKWFIPKVNVTRRMANWPYSRYGIWFSQVSVLTLGEADIAANLRDRGVHIAQYVLPWEFEPSANRSIDDPAPSYWEFIGAVRNLSRVNTTKQGYKARMVLQVGARDENKMLQVARVLRGPRWRPRDWVAGMPVNPDPDLPGYNAWNYTMDVVGRALRLLRERNSSLDGVELDNFMERSRGVDLRMEGFQYLRFPLTYDTNTFKPAIHLSSAAVEYLQRLREWVSREIGGTLTGNFVSEGMASFGAIYLDALPFECSPTGFNWGEGNLSYRRFSAGRKPVIAVLSSDLDPRDQEDLELLNEFINLSVFYGFPPTAKWDVVDGKSFDEVLGQKLERTADVIYELLEAGWRPITGVKVEGGVRVERFGSETVYLTVFNPSESRAAANLTLPREWNVSSIEVIWGICDAELSGGVKLNLSLPPEGVAVLKLVRESPETASTPAFTEPSTHTQGGSEIITPRAGTETPIKLPERETPRWIAVIPILAAILVLLLALRRRESRRR